jgi:hypothetical protein
MKIEPEAAAALRAVMLSDLELIDRLTNLLRQLSDLAVGRASERDAIAAGYYLHNIYNALENSFDQTSRSFENHIKDLARWHQELLHKMFLDIHPVRPALLPMSLKPLLDDLRGFRHRFRHSYDYPLDAVRIVALARAWAAQGPAVTGALMDFIDQLGRVIDPEPGGRSDTPKSEQV